MAYRLPPLNALRLFEAAGRCLSFKLAAEEIGVTPSAVSHGMRSLEDWLGTALFTRGRRSLELTEAGKAFLPRVQAALDMLAIATEEIPGRQRQARLSVSVAPTFGVRWLVPRLPDFNALHPGIDVALDTAQRPVDFPRDGVDLAIRMGGGDWPRLSATCLVGEKLVPVCAPALAAEIATPKDLAGRRLLRVRNVSEDWEAWAKLAGASGLSFDHAVSFDNIDMALEAAAEGLGVAMGRLPLVEGDLAAGRLAAVLGPPRPAATGYWLLTAEGSLSRPEVAAFHDWIAAALEATQQPE